jgi:hypothetical protein
MRNPGADLSTWDKPDAASEATLWIAARPPSYTGNIVTIGDVRVAMGREPRISEADLSKYQPR